MAEHHRLVDDKRPDPSVLILMNVAAANADRIDADPHVARPDRLRQAERPQADTPHTFENQGFHVSFLC